MKRGAISLAAALLLGLVTVAMQDARADEDAPDRNRCIPNYIIGWDYCVLQTQVGNPPGWIVNHAGAIDDCQYHCWHDDPIFPPASYEYDAWQHGLFFMTCKSGLTYQVGAPGSDCVLPSPPDKE